VGHPDRSEVLRAARVLFDQGPLVMRTMQHLRPHICPFEALLRVVPRGASVLDVGCGSGLFLGLLRYFDYDVNGFGFDSSRPAIQCAQAMAKRHGGGAIRFEQIAAGDRWPEGAYDVVSLIDVMHHIAPASQQSAFRAAYERVAPGGILLYKDVSDSPFHLAAANRLHDLVIAREWISYVPVATVEKWATSLGMTMEQPSSHRRLWYQHDLRVFGIPRLG
jgi:2-polyprenyl-3-methyl-5-hydroxy-6-metoxy-1,4-benzoquinol methylase